MPQEFKTLGVFMMGLTHSQTNRKNSAMAQLTRHAVDQLLIQMIDETELDDLQTDNNGQLVFYTSIYRWGDGSFHDEPEHDEIGNPTCTCGTVDPAVNGECALHG